MRPAIVLSLCLVFETCAPASANEAAANLCASSLDAEARVVFDTVQADPQPGQPLRNVLAVKVGGLVAAGKLSIFSARSAATAASECLRIARDCTAEVC
jgi:hypothetical protein